MSWRDEASAELVNAGELRPKRLEQIEQALAVLREISNDISVASPDWDRLRVTIWTLQEMHERLSGNRRA